MVIYRSSLISTQNVTDGNWQLASLHAQQQQLLRVWTYFVLDSELVARWVLTTHTILKQPQALASGTFPTTWIYITAWFNERAVNCNCSMGLT